MLLNEDWHNHDAGLKLNARDRRELARIEANRQAALLNDCQPALRDVKPNSAPNDETQTE